ncbi:uracil-DNA glycosylase [Cenarchaeum symbiosum A]|uniref:Type-5 uracil-DNA glycosylase n=1 Tax=Cenarchaeum symbiosum (strain A) TaxID=414004 RepID=A0RYV5_CENSY|nr:uracil-DNA glycosylase [Cenarchaeum symbiosum A]
MASGLEALNRRIVRCKKCPRLSAYIRDVAEKKVRRHAGEKYWGRPLSGFGDPHARILVVGLAPAAHGGNRTGRMFTGDSSGDWVARALHENGLANKPTSTTIDDGLVLYDTYITAAVRCAPPQNKPLKEEFENCFGYIEEEFKLLTDVRVVVCLGRIAFSCCCRLLGIRGEQFAHGRVFAHGNLSIVCSYHPSRQNTQTGRLTWPQWKRIFRLARNQLPKGGARLKN